MTDIHNHWVNNNPTGTQVELFKNHGWSRNSYFKESYYRDNPTERPVDEKVTTKKNKIK